MDVRVEYLAELSPLLEPISLSSPSGEDPRYDEQFLKIKTEIEKSNYVDYGLIKHLAIELLSEKTKDLRVAGYLIIACGHENGPMGLTTALHVYAHLIQTFWESLHPRRAVARQSAFDWLKHPRVMQLVRDLSSGSRAEREALKRAITHLNLALSKHVGPNSKDLKFLEEWLSFGLENERKISKLGQWVKKAVAAEPQPTRVSMPPPWETLNPLERAERPDRLFERARESEQEKTPSLADHLKGLECKVSEREQFLQSYQAAELCLAQKRYDLALPILENLESQIEQYRLSEWEPQLALEVWVLQMKLFSEYQKQVSLKTIQDLRRKIAGVSAAALV